MENDAATLYCPNELCQAPNPLTHKFCQQCRTPLPKRYVWAVGDEGSVGNSGEILADRYLVIRQSLLLDTKPGLVPQAPELESQAISPYLRLIPYRLHIPQLYGVLPLTDGHQEREILLLEKPPIYDNGTPNQVQLCSQLLTAWGDVTSMRQLNWLWQIAQLWEPLASEGVASSLLEPDLLRVEGSLVRLLELRVDSSTAPELTQLGEFWQQLCGSAKPAIAQLVKQICRSLIQGEINSCEHLIEVLDKGLADVGRTQTPTINIVTKTDTGPSRQRNEDACYPPGGTILSKPPHSTALAIVCDGIGGHEGGNVASNLAIETIQQEVQHLIKLPPEDIIPTNLLTDLELAAAVANDKISQRNDSENRQGRQRMGTTLVMALPVAHEMYITHVGDSRAYWITRHGCYQVTLDDDVASREVRLGYAIYREAVQQGASGSLVQALGMSPSVSLHPTAQRFILDEDCIFLLCSDGLSDFDRVEEYWETEILPILTGETDVVKVTNRLVEIANTKNGHDNVTIALVHCQVKYSEPHSNLTAVIPERSTVKAADYAPTALGQGTVLSSPNQKTQVIPDTKPGKLPKAPLQLGIILLLVTGAGFLGYLAMQWRSLSIPGITLPKRVEGIDPTVATAPGQARLDINVGSEITSTQQIAFNTTPEAPNAVINVPKGSVLQVIGKQPIPELQDSVLQLQICSANSAATRPNQNTPQASRKPSNAKSSATAAKPVVKGEKVWIKLSQLGQSNPTISKPGATGQCQPLKEVKPLPVEDSLTPSTPASLLEDQVPPKRSQSNNR